MTKVNERPDEMTGIEAQRDPEFGAGGNTVENLEDSLDSMDDFNPEQFEAGFSNYENFIVLSKRELSQFIRAVEPLTKATVDQYGKSLSIRSVDDNTVELRYANSPYKVAMTINNKSGKQISTFYMTVSIGGIS